MAGFSGYAWQHYVDREAGFEIDFPQRPFVRPAGNVAPLFIRSIGSHLPNGAFCEVTVFESRHFDDPAFATQVRREFLRQLRTFSEREIDRHGLLVHEVAYEHRLAGRAREVVVVHQIRVGHRLYRLLYSAPVAAAEGEQVERFLGSFRVLGGGPTGQTG